MLGLIGGETHAEADSRAVDEEIADVDVDTEEADRQVAQKLMDPDFSGMIGLGSEEGWNAYIDKENQLVVASRGDSSITLDPNELDDADLDALDRYGLPPSAVMSWRGGLCRAGCWGAAAAGCAAVGAACVGATRISVGILSVPCGRATVTACFAAGAGGSYFSDLCTDEYG